MTHSVTPPVLFLLIVAVASGRRVSRLSSQTEAATASSCSPLAHGYIIAVTGGSGAGKDTHMSAIQEAFPEDSKIMKQIMTRDMRDNDPGDLITFMYGPETNTFMRALETGITPADYGKFNILHGPGESEEMQRIFKIHPLRQMVGIVHEGNATFIHGPETADLVSKLVDMFENAGEPGASLVLRNGFAGKVYGITRTEFDNVVHVGHKLLGLTDLAVTTISPENQFLNEDMLRQTLTVLLLPGSGATHRIVDMSLEKLIEQWDDLVTDGENAVRSRLENREDMIGKPELVAQRLLANKERYKNLGNMIKDETSNLRKNWANTFILVNDNLEEAKADVKNWLKTKACR